MKTRITVELTCELDGSLLENLERSARNLSIVRPYLESMREHCPDFLALTKMYEVGEDAEEDFT